MFDFGLLDHAACLGKGICVCVCACVRVYVFLCEGDVCVELSCLGAWGLGITPHPNTHTHTHARARVSIANKLDAEAMTALVPGLKTLSGLQSLNLFSACERTRGLSARVARACLILDKV